jgi:hypothetical protein
MLLMNRIQSLFILCLLALYSGYACEPIKIETKTINPSTQKAEDLSSQQALIIDHSLSDIFWGFDQNRWQDRQVIKPIDQQIDVFPTDQQWGNQPENDQSITQEDDFDLLSSTDQAFLERDQSVEPLPIDQSIIHPVAQSTYSADRWENIIPADLPNRLLPLEGRGIGNPVITSNNPEAFTGVGLLYGNARETQTRGGGTYPLSGSFGIYLHHLNQSGRNVKVNVIVSNPNQSPVDISARGSIWTQGETNGVGLGTSPDYRVSADWILGRDRILIDREPLASFRPLLIWSGILSNQQEVDGRLEIESTQGVYTYIVVSEVDDSLNTIITQRVFQDASGDYRISGNPAPPFGRTAGIYEFDRYLADFSVDTPQQNGSIAWVVNSAIGTAYPTQAFRGLSVLRGSNQESVGMYGNIYDISISINHAQAQRKRIRFYFGSLSTGMISRYWDGLGLIDQQEVVLRHTPNQRRTLVKELVLEPNSQNRIHFQAMVPGLTSIPQAIWLSAENL